MLLEEIARSLDNIVLNGDIYLGPKEKVKNDEIVVGVLSDELKKFYVFRNNLYEKYRLIWEENAKRLFYFATFSSEISGEDLEAMAREKAFSEKKYEAISALFWFEINRQFPQTLDQNLGVREDWQVIIKKSSLPPELEEFIKTIGLP